MQEVIVVGGGPAGLTAATYLARFRRTCSVLDSGESRARWIPKSHNFPGFPSGVSGQSLVERLEIQARTYGAALRLAHVEDIRVHPRGFEVDVGVETLFGRHVILATGVSDRLPGLPGVREAISRGVLRICPVCDGYEAIGKSIAVIGNGEHAEREADFLTTYSERVTYIHTGINPDPGRVRALQARNIEWIDAPLSTLTLQSNALCLRTASGEQRSFDTCYAAFGCAPRNHFAVKLGARVDESGALIVDSHQQTSVEGLYAVGDVVRGLDQIVVAAAEGALAATHIHNRLRG